MMEVQMLQVAYVVLQEMKLINTQIFCYSTFKPCGIYYILYNHKNRKKKSFLYPHHILYMYTLKPSSLYLYTLSLLHCMLLE